MLKISFIFLFLNTEPSLSVTDSAAFFKYHAHINHAELLLYDGKIKEALESYILAFESMTPSTQDLVNASIAASLNKDQKHAENWLSQAFSRNLPVKVVTKRKTLTRFLGRKKIEEIHKSADRSKIDMALQKSIDSLIVIDQKNRSGKGVWIKL
ncbi:MAG: hypothetical protein LRY55_02490 [Leadbetterella sp.]|nr:hypothetical protein [Leadbetterella sp.]